MLQRTQNNKMFSQNYHFFLTIYNTIINFTHSQRHRKLLILTTNLFYKNVGHIHTKIPEIRLCEHFTMLAIKSVKYAVPLTVIQV